jgi:hypothetical protein
VSDTSFESLHADMAKRGYHDIDEAHGIKAGDRVYHRGQQWPEAREDGTATVLAVMASGRMIQGQPDIELLVHRDKPLTPGDWVFATWADYHTSRATSQPADSADSANDGR